jgi:hypothetical protein
MTIPSLGWSLLGFAKRLKPPEKPVCSAKRQIFAQIDGTGMVKHNNFDMVRLV